MDAYAGSLVKGRNGYHFRKITTRISETRRVRLPHEPSFRQPLFELRLDEIGGYSVLIAPDRANRPQPPQTAEVLSSPSSWRMYKQALRRNNEERRLYAAKFTDDKKLLSFILSQDPSKKVKQAAASNYSSDPADRKPGCDFCSFEKWAEPKEHPAGFSVGWASNPFPLSPQHDVHIVLDPVHNFDELVANPAYAIDLIRLAFIRAKEIYKTIAASHQLLWGINFGIGRPEQGFTTLQSGATIQHVHAQLQAVPLERCPWLSAAPAVAGFKGKFLAAYLEALAKKELIIENRGGAYLVAPWAPKASHHLRILSSVPGLQVENDPADVMDIADAFYAALKVFYGLKVRTFNVVAFSFPSGAGAPSLLIDIVPKMRTGYPELLNANSILHFPEATSKQARDLLNPWREST